MRRRTNGSVLIIVLGMMLACPSDLFSYVTRCWTLAELTQCADKVLIGRIRRVDRSEETYTLDEHLSGKWRKCDAEVEVVYPILNCDTGQLITVTYLDWTFLHLTPGNTNYLMLVAPATPADVAALKAEVDNVLTGHGQMPRFVRYEEEYELRDWVKYLVSHGTDASAVREFTLRCNLLSGESHIRKRMEQNNTSEPRVAPAPQVQH